MPAHRWFLFDLGNVLIQLDYERMIRGLRADSPATREQVIRALERPGGCRDLELGAISFQEFHEHMKASIQYRGDIERFEEVWCSLLAGPVEGIEELLDRVRRHYRVGFLSNTNEVHAERIAKRFGPLFGPEDRFVYSHRYGCAKPDPIIYQRALALLEARPAEVVYADDLPGNVASARDQGLLSLQFTSTLQFLHDLDELDISL